MLIQNQLQFNSEHAVSKSDFMLKVGVYSWQKRGELWKRVEFERKRGEFWQKRGVLAQEGRVLAQEGRV